MEKRTLKSTLKTRTLQRMKLPEVVALYHGSSSMNVSVKNCYFAYNTAITRYGGAISHCGSVNLSSSNFTHNTAGFRGGAISYTERP